MATDIAQQTAFESDDEHDPRSFRFLDLPLELRRMVYGHITEDFVECVVPIGDASVKSHQLNPAIMLSSKRIHNESYNELKEVQLRMTPTLLVDIDLIPTRALTLDPDMISILETGRTLLIGYWESLKQEPSFLTKAHYLVFTEAVFAKAQTPRFNTPRLRDFLFRIFCQMQHAGRLEFHLRIRLPLNQQPDMYVFQQVLWFERLFTIHNRAKFPLVVVLIVDKEHVSFFEHACPSPTLQAAESPRSEFVVRSADGIEDSSL